MQERVSKNPLRFWIAGLAFLSLLRSFAQTPEQNHGFVSLSQIPSSAQRFLLASGTRLRRPGKERITAAGSVTRNQGQPSPVQVTWEVPHRVRVDEGAAAIIFDRTNPAQAIPANEEAAGTIETLLEDSVEGFFVGLREGSTRFLGSGYRLRGAAPGAPSYDIVEVWSRSRLRGSEVTTIKRYWFDKRSKLLSRVVYRPGAVPGGELVEVFWSDWRDVQGEQIPFTVERKEGGRTTLLVRIASAVVSPPAADGRFPAR
jgi:hypothetical protein